MLLTRLLVILPPTIPGDLEQHLRMFFGCHDLGRLLLASSGCRPQILLLKILQCTEQPLPPSGGPAQPKRSVACRGEACASAQIRKQDITVRGPGNLFQRDSPKAALTIGEEKGLRARRLGLNVGAITYWLCLRGQVTPPLCASFFSSATGR